MASSGERRPLTAAWPLHGEGSHCCYSTEAVAAELRAMPCDLVQGYHFGRPLPAAEFHRRIGVE